MSAARRINADRCCGLIIDLQSFFLAQINRRHAAHVRANTGHLLRLLGYFRIPVVATLERPVEVKGTLPKDVARHLGASAQIFEKDFFDLCKEKTIADHLTRLKKRQMIVAGCETDVCVLQSCLGLLSLGYEVYVIEELIFSSSRNVEAAVARLKAAGVVFATYKTLYYELFEAVDGEHDLDKRFAALGPFPDKLPDSAVQ